MPIRHRNEGLSSRMLRNVGRIVRFRVIMSLRGHSILIVESEVASFVRSLQRALERSGAETIVARDAVAALERAKQFAFSVAAINADHLGLVDQLGIPNWSTNPR